MLRLANIAHNVSEFWKFKTKIRSKQKSRSKTEVEKNKRKVKRMEHIFFIMKANEANLPFESHGDQIEQRAKRRNGLGKRA